MEGTKEKVIEIRKAHPEYRLTEIASLSNVTKQRVFKILKDANLPTKGAWARKSNQPAFCSVCGKSTEGQKRYCLTCKRPSSTITIFCDWCKGPISISKKRMLYVQTFLKQKNFFDKRDCIYLYRKWKAGHIQT